MAKAKGKTNINVLRNVMRQVAVSTCDPASTLVALGEDSVAGLSIPFALEYLLDTTVLPLGVVIELLGEPGNNKTTFGHELGRLFFGQGGWYEVFNTEGKVSPKLAHSIVGYPDELGASPFLVHDSDSMEDWQATLVDRVKQGQNWMMHGFKQAKDKAKGQEEVNIPKGAYYPIMYMVDSLMGQQLMATDAAIEKSGSSGRGYAVEAGSLTRYLKVLQRMIHTFPMSAILINHLKIDKVDEWKENLRSPGGNQTKFQATYRIRMTQRAKIHEDEPRGVESLFRRGYGIELSLLKNSLGEHERRIIVPFQWCYFRVKGGDMRQRSGFRWSEALVGLIERITDNQNDGRTAEARAVIREKFDSVVHFRRLRGGLYVSNTFEIKEANAVTPGKLGLMIQADDKIIQGLRDLFGIKKYTLWDGSDDFFSVRDKLKQRIRAFSVSVPRIEG